MFQPLHRRLILTFRVSAMLPGSILPEPDNRQMDLPFLQKLLKKLKSSEKHLKLLQVEVADSKFGIKSLIQQRNFQTFEHEPFSENKFTLA
jgi:hypothetical protein